MGELIGDVLPELPADQTTAGNEHRQLVAELYQIDHSFISPAADVVLHFFSNETHVGAQAALAERRCDQIELLAHALGRGGIGDVLAEDRHGELIGITSAELLIGGAKKSLVALGSGEDRDAIAGKKKGEDIAQAAAAALQEANRIALKLQRVPQKR